MQQEATRNVLTLGHSSLDATNALASTLHTQL